MTTTQPATQPATRPALLEARGLTKHFVLRTTRLNPRGGVVHAACDIDLAVPAGGITAIVGESGSGKSTLARLLARLIKPTAGELLLDGKHLAARTMGQREYARAVQLVLQDPFSSLNPIHDVRYHLARPLKVHKLAGGRGQNGQKGQDGQIGLDDGIASLLGKVSLTPAEAFAAKYPHELSGGQRQRVAIARALAVEPRLLLADEPVSMLDVSIRLGVLNLLGELRDRDGLAIVYVTHDIASARYLADTIAVMYAGRWSNRARPRPSPISLRTRTQNCCSARPLIPTGPGRSRCAAKARHRTWCHRRRDAGSTRAARTRWRSARPRSR